MQPLTVTACDFLPFKIPWHPPQLKGVLVSKNSPIEERKGFYIEIKTAEGVIAQGECAPLEGLSQETLRRVKHELTEMRSFLIDLRIPCDREAVLDMLKHEPHILNACPSVRFAVESAILSLIADFHRISLVEFLGGYKKDVVSAILLQGSYEDVLTDFKRFYKQGVKVFKLKVGDRNIALDVKKIQDIRTHLDNDAYLRLDANRSWQLKEACIFAELAGNQKIDFIEEPLADITQLDVFCRTTRMRVALDETLLVLKPQVNAPARCGPTLAHQEGVVAYVLKPMLLGLVPCLAWIEEAQKTGRKAIISSCYETPVGFKILANLASLSGHVAGLGIERWFKNTKPFLGENGVINKELLGFS